MQNTSFYDSDLATSPDGRNVAFIRTIEPNGPENHDLYVRRIDGTGERLLFDGTYPLVHPRWSPSGEDIVFFDANTPQEPFLTRINVRTRAVQRLHRGIAIPEQWTGSPSQTGGGTILFRENGRRYEINGDGDGLRELGPVP